MDTETERQIDAILAAFDGRETAITDAGRENTRTINRVSRLASVKRVGGENTFRLNVVRYQVGDDPRQLLIGAERAGGGVWRLIARWGD